MQSDRKDKRAKKKKTPCETIPSKLIKICCAKKRCKKGTSSTQCRKKMKNKVTEFQQQNGLSKSTFILLLLVHMILPSTTKRIHSYLEAVTQEGRCCSAKTCWELQCFSLHRTQWCQPLHTCVREQWCTYKNSCFGGRKPNNLSHEIPMEFKS